MNKRFATVILLASATTLAACAKKAPEELPPPPLSTTAPATGPATAPAPTGPTVGSQAHFEDAVNGQNVIFFDTDRFNIDSVDAAALQAQAQYLSRYPQIRITVEGHADERGTKEYNLALGERRANAVQRFLIVNGANRGQIETVSYGEEKPAVMGTDDSSWAQNRRVELIFK